MGIVETSWREELASAYRNVQDLVGDGYLSQQEADALAEVGRHFQFLLPRYYASLIDKNDPFCPIRLQAIPSVGEMSFAPGELPDPLQDLKHQPVARITHRYRSRVLLHLTANCSMYCRFCFRKSLLNELKGDFFSGDLSKSLDYIRDHSEIEEVIFSGGDPFMVGEESLSSVLGALDPVVHLKRIRFHTRVPVTLPARITDSFISVLERSRFRPVVVTHFNHPKEVTLEAARAVGLLRRVATVLNQSVLMKRVNDDADVLIALSERLFEVGVLPYYLHQLDPSCGTQAFSVDIERGKQIWYAMKERVSGFLVPRYVRDCPGEGSKREVVALE